MFPTVEVRWFHEGEIPARIQTWFARLAGSEMAQPRRTDSYLVVGRDDLGIKLREGRIEVKQRQKASGVVRFGDRAAGQLEHWHKWSFALAFGDGIDSAGWIAVNKTRRLRAYRLAQNGVILPAHIGLGCEVELAQVGVGGDEWWTVALEAYATGRDAAAALRLVGRYVFESCEEHVFAGRDSRSYPAWLALLTRGGETDG